MNFVFLSLKVETFCLARAPMKGIPDATNSWASKCKIYAQQYQGSDCPSYKVIGIYFTQLIQLKEV